MQKRLSTSIEPLRRIQGRCGVAGGILAVLLLLTTCRSVPHAPMQALTVEGMVAVRGAEPFTALMLETDDHNLYVLVEADGALQRAGPGRFRVTGTLYKDDWQGRSFAHLRVQAWAPAEEP